MLAVGTTASIRGTLGLFTKIMYAEGVSFEALVAAVRASVGWAAMLIFVLLTRGVRGLKVAPRHLLFLTPLGLVRVGAFYLLYFYTVHQSTVGAAAILLYSSPAFVTLLAWLFLKETLGLSRLLALVLTFAGTFLVVGGYNLATLQVWPFVLVASLFSGLTYGLYSIFAKPVAGKLSPATILSYALGLVGALLLLAATLPTLDTLVGLSPPSSYAMLFALALCDAHTLR